MSFINSVNGDVILGNIIALEGHPSILKHIRKSLRKLFIRSIYAHSAIDHPLSPDVSGSYMIE